MPLLIVAALEVAALDVCVWVHAALLTQDSKTSSRIALTSEAGNDLRQQNGFTSVCE
ncbi:MAG: hypothetical protein H7Z73_12340 [Candidatus Saccharibacteria bacterium]|nr:hypothetical protein [Moraxellaceae bacterium]